MPELFQLKRPIGPNHVVDPGDTVRTKSALAGLGFFEPPEEGITPRPDRPMIEAVADLQRANGLKVDSVINPGGETEQAINAALATGGHFGIPPGTELTKRRLGVEALDPASAERDDASDSEMLAMPDEPLDTRLPDLKRARREAAETVKALIATGRDAPDAVFRGLLRGGAEALFFANDLLRAATTAPDDILDLEGVGNDVSETGTHSIITDKEKAAARAIFDAMTKTAVKSGAVGAP